MNLTKKEFFIIIIAKEQLRDIIKENGIENVADIYSIFKESFKDMLKEMLEAEMDSSLGYTKNNKGDIQTVNKRNGYSTKTVESQYRKIAKILSIFLIICPYKKCYFCHKKMQ